MPDLIGHDLIFHVLHNKSDPLRLLPVAYGFKPFSAKKYLSAFFSLACKAGFKLL